MAKTAKTTKSSKRPAASRLGFTSDEAGELYKRLAKHRPNPKTELDYSSPYTLLVAVVLSAQSTDVGVNKAA